MSNVLKNIPAKQSSEHEIMSDIRYIRKSCSLVTDALKKGCDVLQMPNGDIVITEIRTVSFQYSWNDEKAKFEKVKSGSRLRRLRSQSGSDDEAKKNTAVASSVKGAKAVKTSQAQTVLAKELVDAD